MVSGKPLKSIRRCHTGIVAKRNHYETNGLFDFGCNSRRGPLSYIVGEACSHQLTICGVPFRMGQSLSVRIASAKRRLRRLEEDRPMFLKRIAAHGKPERQLLRSLHKPTRRTCAAQTMDLHPDRNGTLKTGFDTVSDNAAIVVGQAMRAAGCHE